MRALIEGFTEQLKQALEIAEKSALTPAHADILNVVISGMGGSGIGGNIAIEAIASEIRIPVAVSKDYTLPNYVNRHTLVIISSYSGDTEETITAFEEAIERNAKIVCITSNGKVAEIAHKKNIDYILVPPGMPPRAAMGFSLLQVLHILNFFYIISGEFKKNLKASIQLLQKEEANIQKDAKDAAAMLTDKLPILYSTAKMESVALRFRQQLNENAKLLCWHNVFPEMNHNELQAWQQKNKKLAIVIFRNENDHERNAKRIDVSKELFKKYTTDIREIWSKGNSVLEKMLYLIHWGDWVSYFIAEANGTDIMDISSINFLKSELAKE